MSSRIQVVVRLRPDPDKQGVVLSPEAGSIEVSSWRKERNSKAGPNAAAGDNSRIKFQMDRILDASASQEDVFEACGKPFISKFFQGYNGTIMAYGQTGAGKTYTIMGPPAGQYEERGLCARILTGVFEEMEKRRCRSAPGEGAKPCKAPNITLQMSALEIYNETVLDLLAPEPQQEGPAPPVTEDLAIYEAQDGSILVPNLTMSTVTHVNEALQCLFTADMARAVGEHDLNADSTRSHCIYTLHLTVRSYGDDDDDDDEGTVTTAKLHIVDLAGSERIFKTGSSGVLQKEAAFINKSLSFLEQVVVALTDEKREHIPYRQSKLTHFLKDSLNGNCTTLLVACVWPVPYHSDQTISTLRFAQRMMCIRTEPVVNRGQGGQVSSAYVGRLLKQIKDLKEELAMHDRLARRDLWLHQGGPPYGDLTHEQLRAVHDQVSAFIADPAAMPPVLTVAQCRAIFQRLRDAAVSSQQREPYSDPHSSNAEIQSLTVISPVLDSLSHPPPQVPPPPPPVGVAPDSCYYSDRTPSDRLGPGTDGYPASSPPRYHPHQPSAMAITPQQDPPTTRSYFFMDSERETTETPGAKQQVAGEGYDDSRGGSRSVMVTEGKEVEGDDDDEDGREEGGEGADGEREQAFARFRLTDIGTYEPTPESQLGMKDAGALKTVKSRLRHVKERLKLATRNLKACMADLGAAQQGQEEKDEVVVDEEEEEQPGQYAEGYMRRDVIRRRDRLRQQVSELQEELRSLHEDKKVAVRRMIKDFKAWWREGGGGCGGSRQRAGLADGEEQDEATEAGAGGEGLSLPALALPTTRAAKDPSGRAIVQPPPRPWSMAEGSSGAVPSHHHGTAGPELGAGGGPGGVPLLSSAQVSYEIARQHALVASASGKMNVSSSYGGHNPPTNVPFGRSPARSSGGNPPPPHHHRSHTVSAASVPRVQQQAAPRGRVINHPHRRQHSASL